MKHFSKLFILLLLAAFQLPASSVITLDEAVASAMENNTDLATAQVSLQTAMRNNSLSSSFIPDISIEGGVSLSGMSITDRTAGTLGTDVSLGISLSLDSSLISETKINAIAEESALLSYIMTAESVEEAVTLAYWNIALIKDSIQSAELALQDARERLESLESQYEAGSADLMDVRSAELDMLNYENSLAGYEAQLELAYIAFSQLTGITSRDFETEEIPVLPALNLPDAKTLEALYSSNSTMLKSLEKNIESAQAQKDSTRSSLQLPSVSISASYDLGPTVPAGSLNDYRTDRGSVTVGFTIPVSAWIPGSDEDLSVKAAQDEVTKAAISLEDGKNDFLYSLEEALSSYNQALLSLDIAERTLSIAEETYRLAQERYEAGLISLEDVSDAQRDMLDAEFQISQCRIEILTSLYSIAFDTGLDLEDLITLYTAEETNE